MKGDRMAIGGFIEAMVAIVAVCCGIILISISLTAAAPEMTDPGHQLRDEMDRALGILMGEGGLMPRDGIVEVSKLDVIVPLVDRLEEGRSCVGMRAAVIELHPETKTVWTLTLGEAADGLEVFMRSVPVNIQHSASDIRTGLLVISVW